jgi:hypothetical protein
MSIIGKLQDMIAHAQGCVIVGFPPTGELDILKLDVVTDENANEPGTVNDNPAEGEVSFADSIYRGPTELQISGMFTSTPIQFLAALTAPLDNAKSKLRKLLELRDREEPVVVVTSLRVYTNMGIEGVSHHRSAETGDAVEVSIMMRKINIVTIALVPSQFDLDAQLVGGGGLVDLGTQSTLDPRDYSGPTAVSAG